MEITIAIKCCQSGRSCGRWLFREAARQAARANWKAPQDTCHDRTSLGDAMGEAMMRSERAEKGGLVLRNLAILAVNFCRDFCRKYLS